MYELLYEYEERKNKIYIYTAGFMKPVPSLNTLLMNTIYLSHSKQVAEGTVSRKHTVHEMQEK